MNEILFKDFIKLQRGFDLPKTQMIEGDYPVIGSITIIGYHNEYKVDPPGVITGRSGSLGFVQYIKKKYWPHNTSLWVKDFKGNQPKYVYYFLKVFGLERFNSGAGVPTLNRNDLDNYEIQIHEIETQQKIASILSVYDDLIENNTRRIKILEEMAQTIYKEWFVNFRFPGYEKVRFVKSPLGKIPEGWEVKKIGEICKVGRGSSPRPIADKKYFEGGNIPWIKIADATASGKFLYQTKEKVNEYGASFSRIMDKGSLIVATSGTLGFCLFLGVKGCIHDGWLYMSDYKDVSPSFLYFVLNANREAFNNQSYGAAIQNINTDILRNTMFVLPVKELLEKFVQFVDIIDREINNLSRKNINLRKTRDLLLPKLMSGEVEV